MNIEFINRILKSSSPILVGFSGGKDSVAMVLHLLELGVSTDRIHLHHHDVDGAGEILFDWHCTSSYVKAFADAFGLKLFISYRKGGIIRQVFRNNEAKQDVYFQKEPGGEFFIAPSDKDAINTMLKWPAVSASLTTRWCSATAKIEVFLSAIRNNENYLGEIFILTGERREESPNRAKYKEIEYHGTVSRKRLAISWRPVIDWNEAQVWDIMKRWNVQPHPCYMIGWNRCSCQLCIFGSSNIWATIDKISPDKVNLIAAAEETIGHTVYNKATIRDKIAKGKAFEDIDPYWLSQAIGEFTAPILIDSEYWAMPAGAFKTETAGSL